MWAKQLFLKFLATKQLINNEFNYCLAKACVINEHCIGILKGKWILLKEIYIQVN